MFHTCSSKGDNLITGARLAHAEPIDLQVDLNLTCWCGVSKFSVCTSGILHQLLKVNLSPPTPSDPTQWTEDQVYRWAEWVAQEFNLTTVNLQALRGVTGHQLCSFGQRQFQELAYIKEHGLTLQHFLERIKANSVGKSITLCVTVTCVLWCF